MYGPVPTGFRLPFGSVSIDGASIMPSCVARYDGNAGSGVVRSIRTVSGSTTAAPLIGLNTVPVNGDDL